MLECYGTANTSDACLQCPDNEACCVETIKRWRDATMSEDKILILDDTALRKRYSRRRFRELRNLHALDDCREDYLEACWEWLYGKVEVK